MSCLLEAAKESKLFDKIHGSTDSELIADTVKRIEFEIDFTRGPGWGAPPHEIFL